MHVSEPEIAALEFVGQPLVIDPHQMEHRAVQIMHGADVIDGVVAEFVGRTVRHATLKTSAGDEDGKAFDVMVAAVALGHRCAAEFAAENE